MTRKFFGVAESAIHHAARAVRGRIRALLPWLVPLLVLVLVALLTLSVPHVSAGSGAAIVLALVLLQAALVGLLAPARVRVASGRHLPIPSRIAQPRDAVEALLGDGTAMPFRSDEDTPGRDGAALVVRLDDGERLRGHHGARYVAALMGELADRLGNALRAEDAFCHLPPEGFAIALQPRSGLDVATVLAIAKRIQAQLGTRFEFEAVGTWPSISIGLCLSAQAARRQGLGMLDAAEQAAERALRAGPGGLHSFSVIDMPGLVSSDRRQDIQHALESGAICAHFQPQIDAGSGQVSGLEALARWEHPERGLIPPGEFLPLIEKAGLAPQLARRMLDCALAALARLDAAGLAVPAVAVNLSVPELRSPSLADEIAWALEQHDLQPERLVVEILEDVITLSDDDIMVRNIARLAGMGCGIDLDDFGTGHASIASIRRFAVGRLKIDRSFITNLHRDQERQRMAGAILSMADGLGLDTIAEGVENAEEMALVTAMGCTHLQGFGIARPMPESALAPWLAERAAQGCRPLREVAAGDGAQPADARPGSLPEPDPEPQPEPNALAQRPGPAQSHRAGP
ncbi:MAG: GGDEF domain-containing protein [Pararhodobacter sp.]|nr:GGDEF domain-containing protein [Pararhodobacter sp.]